MPNHSDKKSFTIEANSKSTHADISLYGVVGGWKVNIQRFQDELNQYKTLKTINVYISTLGGTFMDGLPIYNLLRQHAAHVTTINMGYALSMGSVMLLAGDRIKMAQNGLLMIHSPNVEIWDPSNAQDLRKEADLLDKHQSAMIPRYRERMALSDAEIIALLTAETWYTADEALAAGLIDEILDPIDFDEVEDQMTEDHWRETVATLRREPPKSFMNRLMRHVPEAKARFDFKNTTPAPASGDDIEDDIMTPEQQAALEQSMKDSIASAATEAATKALVGLDDKIEQAVTAAMAPIKEGSTASATSSESVAKLVGQVKDQLTSTEETLKKVTDAQAQQAETLAATKAMMDELKALPVNASRAPVITDGDQGTSDEQPYS